MDEFLADFREPPRPAFAQELAARLAASPPAGRVWRRRIINGLGLGAVSLSVLLAFGWGVLSELQRAMVVNAQPVALLLPTSAHPVASAASAHRAPIGTLLVAPPTPLSHHH